MPDAQDILQQYSPLDQLSNSAPTGKRDWRNVLWDALESADRNVLHPIHRAGLAPMHALANYVDPTGRDPFWHPQVGEYRMAQLEPTINAIDAIGQHLKYEPGERESTNTEGCIPLTKPVD